MILWFNLCKRSNDILNCMICRLFQGTSKVPAIKGITRIQWQQSISSNSLGPWQEDQSTDSNSWQTKLTSYSNQASNMSPLKTEIHMVNPQAYNPWNQNQLHPKSNLQQTQSTNNHPWVQLSSNNRKGTRFPRDRISSKLVKFEEIKSNPNSTDPNYLGYG